MNALGQAGGTGVPVLSYRDSWLAVEQVILWTSVFSHHTGFTVEEVKRGTATALNPGTTENTIIKCIIKENK